MIRSRSRTRSVSDRLGYTPRWRFHLDASDNLISFVIDERLRTKKGSSKDIFVSLKSSLKCDEALWFAEYVIKWEQIPADKRLHLMREKQEHFQKLRMENAMGSSTPTTKQISYLHSLGCTVVPESKLHASRLIEQYKSL